MTTLTLIFVSLIIFCNKSYVTNSFKVFAVRKLSTTLRSYGDPDNTEYSGFTRWLQQSIRVYDKLVFPDEVDTPGLTFPTPIIWAPWLETIWFGNAYDYRAAFFHDVIYSNNMPYKEGALFFRNKISAQKIALLYQRYRKFDLSSYSAQNATFYNIFGEQSLRIGRFKYPLTDNLILCVMDPLTFSDMRRYFNTFNLLKLFQKKYFQLKRKRQKVLSIKNPLFLNEAVHTIEYSHFVEQQILSSGSKEKVCIIPTIAPIQFSAGTSGLRVSTAIANSQHFLEILFQSILQNIIRCHSSASSNSGSSDQALTVLISGDGRYLNSLAIDVFLRVAAGNNVKTVLLTPNNIVSTPSASLLLMGQKTSGNGSKGRKDSSINDYEVDAAILLTASHNAGGPRGYFGVKVNLKGGVTASDELWAEIARDAAVMKEFRAVASRPPTLPEYEVTKDTASKPQPQLQQLVRNSYGPVTRVEVLDDVPSYIAYLRKSFDIPLLKQLIDDFSLSVVFDCMHGAAGPYVKAVLRELGLDEACAVRSKHLPDFGGFKPDPNRANTGDMQTLFEVPELDQVTLLAGVEPAFPLSLESDTRHSAVTLLPAAAAEKTDLSETPDIGFSFDADVDRCMILGPGLMVSPSDSLAVVAAHHTAIPLFRDAGGLKVTARSVVTAPAVDAVAASLGLRCYQTPTGWKWMSRLFQQLQGEMALAGEESFGLGSSALPEKDGIWTALAWLSVLTSENSGRKGRFVGVAEVLQRHWKRFGRSYSLRLDLGDLAATDAMAILQRIASLADRQAAGWMPPAPVDPLSLAVPVSDSTPEPLRATSLFMDQEEESSLMVRERVAKVTEAEEVSSTGTIEVVASPVVEEVVLVDPLEAVLQHLWDQHVSVRRHTYEIDGQPIAATGDYIIETRTGGRVLFRVSGTESGTGKEAVTLRLYVDQTQKLPQEGAEYSSPEAILAPLVALAYEVSGLNNRDELLYPTLVT